MMVAIKLKWNGQTYDLEVDISKTGIDLKSSIMTLTQVPIDRQKVMAKGLWKGTLKDEQNLQEFSWKEGTLVAMMGTAEVMKAPEKPVTFIEDMTAVEKQKVAALDPPGLYNLGNTCYMNSVLQCLKSIPELRTALDTASLSSNSADNGERMVQALKFLLRDMDHAGDAVTPASFVSTMRVALPQFAEKTAQGGFAQQDADEFFNELLTVLARHLRTVGGSFAMGNKSDAIAALFGLEMSVDTKCIESDEEPVSKSSEVYRRLQCNIAADTNGLEQGIKLGLEAEIEKNSTILGRNCIWKQTRRIHKLPKYLSIQLNRFFWKKTPDSRDHTGVNCKILKPVKFSFTLDVYDLCDDSLKSILKAPRDVHAKKLMMRGREAETTTSSEQDTPMTEEERQEAEDLETAMQLSMAESAESAGLGIPNNFRGVYELYGVVTHKGRASDSGHYMGWVKQDTNKWICFDDEQGSPCTEEDVGQLSGGGDYDMAYMLFYRAKE